MKEFLADPSKLLLSLLLQLLEVLPKKRKKKRLKSLRKKVTTTWDSVFLTKCNSLCQHEINVT